MAKGGSTATNTTNRWLLLVGALVLALAALLVWKIASVNEVEATEAERRAELVSRHGAELDDQTETMLETLAVPLVWALRTQIMQSQPRDQDRNASAAGDMSRVNRYLIDLVQQPGVEQIVFALPGGEIAVSTDKNIQGNMFDRHYPADLLDVETARVDRIEEGVYRVAAPVLGLNEHLGTVVLTYRRPQPQRHPGEDQ